MEVDIAIPDYSCLSKRSIDLRLERLAASVTAGSHILVDSTGLKVYGKDEWNQEKYGIRPQRSWRKLHLAIDEKHQIIASDLTEKSVGDISALNHVQKLSLGKPIAEGFISFPSMCWRTTRVSMVIPLN